MDKIELLAPAGDLERLKIVLLYGADAVYLGGQNYSLRANATNFTLDELKEGCSFAHSLGKKVYQTVNIVFHNEDMDGVEEYLKQCVDAGVDAFIVSDPFIISYIKDNFKGVEAHLSTQNSTTNYKAVEYFKDEGIDRVVLARELSRDEIKEIIDKTKIDTEVFIHGAMCTCFSGRCALSNYVTNRDANRGGCAQVCRFSFKTDGDDFTLATKDLNMARYIKDLIDIGVKSLKVEGRMRSIYYLATVIGSYRRIIDNYYNETLTESVLDKYVTALDNVANRDTTSQYFNHKADYTDQYFTGRQEISNQDFLALINGYDHDNKCLIVSEKNYFKIGDTAEIFTPSGEIYSYEIKEIYDEDMNKLEVANHPEQILKLPFIKEVEKFSMIRIIKRK